MADKASLHLAWKRVLDSGVIIQVKVWRLPQATPERPHGFKYSLFYGRDGERIVGYDNEAGKGDHKHHRATEAPYHFTSLDRLLADFQADIEKEIRDERAPHQN